MKWILLISSLPGKNPTPRMRLWRALKNNGAGIVRDGVYLLPRTAGNRELLDAQAQMINDCGGSAQVISFQLEESSPENQVFAALFDRSEDYREWTGRVTELHTSRNELDEVQARRKEVQLRKELEQIAAIDFFPGTTLAEARVALDHLASALNQTFSPGEPSAQEGTLEILDISKYQGRTWATRKNLWVDRVASAWLIRTHIDTKARFKWLDKPRDIKTSELGFDFDGADFTHTDDLVTFEVLLKQFQLDTDPALAKIGSVIHYLDVGGIAVDEAAGFLTLLSGAKTRAPDDDDFLVEASVLLENLYSAYRSS